MDNIKISIILPVFNEEKYIISNIHNQAHPNFYKMKEFVIDTGYYWEWFSEDIKIS